jgi:hypothetical protein
MLRWRSDVLVSLIHFLNERALDGTERRCKRREGLGTTPDRSSDRAGQSIAVEGEAAEGRKGASILHCCLSVW